MSQRQIERTTTVHQSAEIKVTVSIDPTYKGNILLVKKFRCVYHYLIHLYLLDGLHGTEVEELMNYVSDSDEEESDVTSYILLPSVECHHCNQAPASNALNSFLHFSSTSPYIFSSIPSSTPPHLHPHLPPPTPPSFTFSATSSATSSTSFSTSFSVDSFTSPSFSPSLPLPLSPAFQTAI